jgi:transcriptional regulator with XRE-family HTH domain
MQHEANRTVHEGRNVKRIREILGIKQETLAFDLGISQQAISALEQKEALDKEMLEKVANALKISPDAIRNFNEEGVINNISCDFNDHSSNNVNYNYNFNPIDKIVELYDTLLQSEREKIALLERMLQEKSGASTP